MSLDATLSVESRVYWTTCTVRSVQCFRSVAGGFWSVRLVTLLCSAALHNTAHHDTNQHTIKSGDLTQPIASGWSFGIKGGTRTGNWFSSGSYNCVEFLWRDCAIVRVRFENDFWVWRCRDGPEVLQEVNEDEAVVDVTAPNPPVDENIKSLKKKSLLDKYTVTWGHQIWPHFSKKQSQNRQRIGCENH